MVSEEYLEYLKATNKLDEFASNLYGMGWTTGQIAEAFRTSRQTVSNMLDRHTEALMGSFEQAQFLERRKPGRPFKGASDEQ
jgi:hypothetical protein